MYRGDRRYVESDKEGSYGYYVQATRRMDDEGVYSQASGAILATLRVCVSFQTLLSEYGYVE